MSDFGGSLAGGNWSGPIPLDAELALGKRPGRSNAESHGRMIRNERRATYRRSPMCVNSECTM